MLFSKELMESSQEKDGRLVNFPKEGRISKNIV